MIEIIVYKFFALTIDESMLTWKKSRLRKVKLSTKILFRNPNIINPSQLIRTFGLIIASSLNLNHALVCNTKTSVDDKMSSSNPSCILASKKKHRFCYFL